MRPERIVGFGFLHLLDCRLEERNIILRLRTCWARLLCLPNTRPCLDRLRWFPPAGPDRRGGVWDPKKRDLIGSSELNALQDAGVNLYAKLSKQRLGEENTQAEYQTLDGGCQRMHSVHDSSSLTAQRLRGPPSGSSPNKNLGHRGFSWPVPVCACSRHCGPPIRRRFFRPQGPSLSHPECDIARVQLSLADQRADCARITRTHRFRYPRHMMATAPDEYRRLYGAKLTKRITRLAGCLARVQDPTVRNRSYTRRSPGRRYSGIILAGGRYGNRSAGGGVQQVLKGSCRFLGRCSGSGLLAQALGEGAR